MPRSDLFPSDIMDKHAAFAGALNDYLRLVQDWEIRAFDPNQPRIPAGEPGAGQWLNEGEEAPDATDAPGGPTPAPTQTSPAMAVGAPPQYQVSLRPPDIPNPGDPFLGEAAKDPTGPQFYRQIRTTPTYVAMYNTPTFVDPNLGFPRSSEKFFIGLPDMTRPGVPYVEAFRFDSLKDLFLPALPNYEFHHVVGQMQWPFFTDRPNDPRSVNNSSNIVLLPREEHICVSAIYSRLNEFGIVNREALKGKPYASQYSFGLSAIKECQADLKYDGNLADVWSNQIDNISPPILPPLLSPRIFGRSDIRHYATKALFILAQPDLERVGFPMALDLTKLQSILESLHECEVDNSEATITRSNQLKTAARLLFHGTKKSEADWQAIETFLTHPFKYVRVWIAVEFMIAGRKQGWPVLRGEVAPQGTRMKSSDPEAMRNFAAHIYGYMYLVSNAGYLDNLDLSPSLTEVEDRWILEGRINHRFLRSR